MITYSHLYILPYSPCKLKRSTWHPKKQLRWNKNVFYSVEAFTSDLQLIKTTTTQPYRIWCQFVEKRTGFLPSVVFGLCLFVFNLKVSWVQAALELRSNLINVSCCSFMEGCGESCMLYCWTCMKLAIKLLQMPRFITDKAHPQIRCHLVFVSSLGCGKFSYYHLRVRKLSPGEAQ